MAGVTFTKQGHIGIATALFPDRTVGAQLDSFARRPLWEVGLDYDHGTGHGVGSYLSVHEGPQNISKKPVNQKLLPGMICSNEPGFYKAGAFGIRIENLVVVTDGLEIPGGERKMMGFETITMVPIDLNLVEPGLLTEGERAWLNPSPNAPNLSMARAYAGTVMVEGTTLSEGRGARCAGRCANR